MFLLLACSSSPVPIDTDADADTDADSDTDTDADTDTDTVSDLTCGGEPCGDGLACTEDACDAQDRCVHTPVDVCEWPSALPPDVTALAGLEPDFDTSLSGATWNAETRELWVIRGNGATAWSLSETDTGWEITREIALWSLDLESVVVVDPVGAPELLHMMVEHQEIVVAFDVSDPANPVEVRSWDTSVWLTTDGTAGSEALTFVPDAALAEWGFVDEAGLPRVSALGYGGLFFVGTQVEGMIHVFDLSATDNTVERVGSYHTARTDTSALEFDHDTGRLYIWHGGDDNDLEVARLDSVDLGGGERGLSTEAVFDYPGDDNLEGFALFGTEDCGANGRPLVFTIDDGDERALDIYPDWPLCR